MEKPWKTKQKQEKPNSAWQECRTVTPQEGRPLQLFPCSRQLSTGRAVEVEPGDRAPGRLDSVGEMLERIGVHEPGALGS